MTTVTGYDALRDYLTKQKLPEFVLSFEAIEERARVVNDDDVGVRQLRDRLRLTQEAGLRSPVGRLRWQPPQPVAHWKGVRDATNFAASSFLPWATHISTHKALA